MTNNEQFVKDAPSVFDAYIQILNAAIEKGGFVNNFEFETDDYVYRLAITQNKKIKVEEK